MERLASASSIQNPSKESRHTTWKPKLHPLATYMPLQPRALPHEASLWGEQEKLMVIVQFLRTRVNTRSENTKVWSSLIWNSFALVGVHSTPSQLQVLSNLLDIYKNQLKSFAWASSYS